MSLSNLLGEIETSDPVATESDYLKLWQDLVRDKGSAPFELAVRGGVLADRFSWVFIAGYQAAIRHVFVGETFQGWAAFAVSEDRSEDNPLPGVTYEETEGHVVIHGSKTWVAASMHCTDIVFSAGKGGNKRFYRAHRDEENLVVETRPPGRMLPDLSQGSAHFHGVGLKSDKLLDTRLVPGFGACEVVYIYAAFLASTWVRAPAERDETLRLLTLAASICAREEIARDDNDMIQLDQGVQSLLQHLRQEVFGDIDLWRRDYKLIAMYARR